MIDLPKNWPQFCLDLKQLTYLNGNFRLVAPDADLDGGPEHHALADARWTKRAWGAAWVRVNGPLAK
jgi:hypothetical protein